MNDFITQLTEDIMDTIEEDRGYPEKLLKHDIKHILACALNDHDEEIRREAKAMIDEDEVYDDGFEDGYAAGWNEAKEEMREAINDLHVSK